MDTFLKFMYIELNQTKLKSCCSFTLFKVNTTEYTIQRA